MAEPITRIEAIRIANFKSFGPDAPEVALRPLTLLAGANSSGKSSLLQPLLMLKQTLEAPGDAGALLLNGDHVQFSEAAQFYHGKSKVFSIGVKLSDGDSCQLTYGEGDSGSLDILRAKYSWDAGTIEIGPGMDDKTINENLPEELAAFQKLRTREDTRWNVYRDRCFLRLSLRSLKRENKLGQVRFGIDPIVEVQVEDTSPQILSIIHLPGLRGNPRRTYQRMAVERTFPGTFDRYTASIIHEWETKKDNRLAALASSLEALGLTWKVQSKRLDDTQLQLKVGRLPRPRKGGAHDLVSIADVGFGVSQTLPVLVALHVATPGQLVYLEQPEIHLHPLAQRKLARLLVEASQRGALIVAETHSAILIREVQTLIAQGKANAEDVALHWFARDKEGVTQVTTADLDERGAYGDWPADFDEVELEAERDYLDAVEQRGPFG